MVDNNLTTTFRRHWLWAVMICIIVAAAVFAAYKSGSKPVTATSGSTAPAADVALDVMVLIPAGAFIMGSNDVDASGKSQESGFDEPLYLNEHPKRKVVVNAFYIDKYEVTSGQFKKYLRKLRKYTDAQIDMLIERLQLQQDNLPVRNITWFKADEYCRAAGKRLPSEAEWEKAARGTDGREYPWGNEWHAEYLNGGQGESDLTPVGSYEDGKSPYGIYDMAGNVMEWTADWYEAYPGAEYQSSNYGKKHRVARGGSWSTAGRYTSAQYFRVAYRFNFPPNQAFNDVGFRCARKA